MQKLYPDKKYFTISETAELLGVSIDTLRRLETRGMLKIKREDGRRIYTQRDLLVLKKLYAGAEDPNNILLPVHEAANWLGVSVDTLRRWEKAGKLEAVRTAGGHRRYRLSAIQDAQAGLKPSPAGVHPATRNVLVKHIHHYMSSPSQRLYEPAAELYKTLHIDQKRVLKLGLATLAILLLLLGLKRASIIGYRQSAISHQPSAIDSRVLQAESVNEDVIFAVNIPTNLRGLATFEQGLTVAGTASFEDVDIANDLTLAGDLAVNGGDITTTATTASIFNTNATTLDIGEAATAISIGATTGTTTINNDLILSGNLDVNGTGTNDIAGTLNLSGNNLSSPGDLVLNLAGGSLIFTNAQTINIGGSSSHVAYNVIGDSTSGASSSMTSDDDLYVEGNLEVDGSITGSISSTIINPGFTTGSVVFQGASGLAQDNTNFFWDDTNNRLGVGTNSPSGVLHVVGECVAAGTKIRRRRRRGKNGEWEEEDIPVEDIQPGDEVLSLNDQTGRFEWHKVEKTMNKGTQDTYALTTSSGKRILTTRQHPYLVIDKPLITQGTFEVDQSIRIEELAQATIVGIALGNLMFASKIPPQTKKAILRRYQKPNRRNLFAVHTFAHAVALTFKAASIYPARVIIDTEYPGFNRPIREIIQLYFPETTVLFDEIGKHSPAHLAAYGVFIGKRKEDVVLEGVSETKKDRGHKALRIVTDQDRRLTIRNPHGLNSKKSYYTPRDLSRGKWTKISQIRKGQYIATIDGWEKVAGIQRIKRLKTYDLQIEGTHNFIGNNIVAHNTFLGGSITLGAVSGDTLTFNASTLATPNNLNIDSNTLFIDAANNRVGIGTVTPSTTLHTLATNAVHRIETNVQGTGTAELRLTGVNAGNARFISFYETASGDLELYRLGTDNPNGSNALVLRDQSVNVITIQDNGAADTLYLRSSGNGGTVGINTSTPNEKLEIAGGLRVGQAPTTFTTVTDNPLT
ncbi:MerR family transcriptional regulator, partial [Candidatus Woesebacteria bacterium]|nr:MerR family transcriptional regulator [Candidatus Woesebacteria bacterium]